MTTHSCGKNSLLVGQSVGKVPTFLKLKMTLENNRILWWFRMGMLKQVVGNHLDIKYHRITKIA